MVHMCVQNELLLEVDAVQVVKTHRALVLFLLLYT